MLMQAVISHLFLCLQSLPHTTCKLPCLGGIRIFGYMEKYCPLGSHFRLIEWACLLCLKPWPPTIQVSLWPQTLPQTPQHQMITLPKSSLCDVIY